METIREVPSTHPYQYGQTLLHVLPGGFDWMGQRMGNQLEYIVFETTRPTYTAPAMFIAELWLNFGVLGVLFGGGVYGVALKTAYQAGADSQNVLARGLYPLALLAVFSALPTSFEWAIKSMFLRFGIPVTLAILVAYGCSQVMDLGHQKSPS